MTKKSTHDILKRKERVSICPTCGGVGKFIGVAADIRVYFQCTECHDIYRCTRCVECKDAKDDKGEANV